MQFRDFLLVPLCLLLIGCSDGRSDPIDTIIATPDFPVNEDLTGSWKLVNYSLDDGTSREVPESALGQITFNSDNTLEVSYTCGGFEAQYFRDNNVLTTTESQAPELQCDAEEADANARERNDLLFQSLFDSQTMIEQANEDMFALITIRNEGLVFERIQADTQLQNTMWRLSSIERDDGSIYTPQPELSYFLSLNDDNFRIQFWCVYREGNYSVLNDGVLTTTSLNDMEVFSCPPPPTTEPADIEDLLTSFFDGKTIVFVQTESELELSSVSNEVLRFAACETNCSNIF